MGLLKKLTSLFGGGEGRGGGDAHWEYVQCSRCGEKIPVRIDLNQELTPQYGDGKGAYFVRKGIVGSGDTLCFQTIEVRLYFDARKRLISRDISGGEFITREEFEADRQEEQGQEA